MAKDNEIVESLRNRLILGQFAPGLKLQPEKLRLDYGCSASTLREALFRLSTERLVDFQEQRGFRAPLLSPKLQHELTLMRILLESEGACLSMRHGGVEWEARLSAAHYKLSHIESRVRRDKSLINLIALWSAAELEFHQKLFDACQSETMKEMHRILFYRFRQQLITSDKKFVYVPENEMQHKAILNAALDRDEARVRQGIRDHLKRNLMQPEPA